MIAARSLFPRTYVPLRGLRGVELFRGRRRGLPLVLTLSALLGSVHAQQPAFRARTDLVRVEVAVFDKAWQPVPGISATDFTVLEDDRPRPIASFTPVETLLEPRLVLIVVDESLPPRQHDTARRLARAAVDTLRSGDEAAVVFAGRVGDPPQGAFDRNLLLAAINAPFPTLSQGSCLLNVVMRLADRIGSVPGRRTVMDVIGPLFKSAEPSKNGGPCGATREEVFQTIEAAKNRTQVAINAVDPTDGNRRFDPHMSFAESQFVLAFEPANPADTVQRRIQLKVKHKGVHAMRWTYCRSTCR